MERQILKFLTQHGSGALYTLQLNDSIFLDPINKVIFGLLKGYYQSYKYNPTREHFEFYLDKSSDKVEVDDKLMKIIRTQISSLYIDLPDDKQIIEDEIVYAIRKILVKQMFITHAPNLNTPDDAFYNGVYRDITKIISIKSGAKLQDQGTFLLRDFEMNKSSLPVGQPCLLKGVNNMTGSGGFYSPQLIIWMGGPKTSKTLLLISLAVDYMRNGLNIFYADFENGKNSIIIRMAQHILECEKAEVVDGTYNNVFKGIREDIVKYGGGDIRVHAFKGRKDDTTTVETELNRLEMEENWVPDLIIWDYIDIMEASDKSIKDKRLKIQYNYHQIIGINKDRGCFSMSVSKVKGNAFNAEIISVHDFGEDMEKAYNCHAAFAICRTEEEVEAGIARIIPVVQRDGVSFRPDIMCTVKIDNKNQQLLEIPEEELLDD